MPAVITPQLAVAALRLKHDNPRATARAVLDACLKGRSGSVADFGRELEPDRPFARLVAEAFGEGELRWAFGTHLTLDTYPRRQQELRRRWWQEVVPRFAAAYGLAP